MLSETVQSAFAFIDTDPLLEQYVPRRLQDQQIQAWLDDTGYSPPMRTVGFIQGYEGKEYLFIVNPAEQYREDTRVPLLDVTELYEDDPRGEEGWIRVNETVLNIYDAFSFVFGFTDEDKERLGLLPDLNEQPPPNNYSKLNTVFEDWESVFMEIREKLADYTYLDPEIYFATLSDYIPALYAAWETKYLATKNTARLNETLTDPSDTSLVLDENLKRIEALKTATLANQGVTYVCTNNWPEGQKLPKEILVYTVEEAIDNAFKYTGEDGGEVHVSFNRDHSGVNFCVQDNGIGISIDEVGQLFHGQFRGQEAIGRAGGKGLGLFRLAQMVFAVGGSIELLSRDLARNKTHQITVTRGQEKENDIGWEPIVEIIEIEDRSILDALGLNTQLKVKFPKQFLDLM